jgi:hypothetical protein
VKINVYSNQEVPLIKTMLLISLGAFTTLRIAYELSSFCAHETAPETKMLGSQAQQRKVSFNEIG